MNVIEHTQRIYPDNSTVSKSGTKGNISQHIKRYLGKDPPYKLSSLNQTSVTIKLNKDDYTHQQISISSKSSKYRLKDAGNLKQTILKYKGVYFGILIELERLPFQSSRNIENIVISLDNNQFSYFTNTVPNLTITGYTIHKF